jgi:hypothetical protein
VISSASVVTIAMNALLNMFVKSGSGPLIARK